MSSCLRDDAIGNEEVADGESIRVWLKIYIAVIVVGVSSNPHNQWSSKLKYIYAIGIDGKWDASGIFASKSC